MTYVIAQPCVDLKDKACIEECPVDCIYEGERTLYIHPDECVDCGACEPVCPVEAIFYEDDVPEQWKDYYKANVEFFDDLGSPGGAAKLGLIPKDHPVIVGAAAAGARLTAPAGAGLAGERGRPGSSCRTSPGTCSRPYGARARAHPGGIVDLSVGTPVDPDAAAWSGRRSRPPRTRPATRRPTAPPRCARRSPAWFARRRGVPDVDPTGVLPTIGSKELVAWLPTLLGLGPGDLVVHPEIAYPTYDVGARLAGATPVPADGTAQLGPRAGRVRLIWLNSPVATPPAGCSASSTWRKVVAWARSRRRGRGQRRVLRRAGLGGRDAPAPSRACSPGRLRRLPTRAARGLLD